jgi:hypothetical protein
MHCNFPPRAKVIIIYKKEKESINPWVSSYTYRKKRRQEIPRAEKIVWSSTEQTKKKRSKHVAFASTLTLKAERALFFSRRLVRIVRRLHLFVVIVVVESTTVDVDVVALALVDF